MLTLHRMDTLNESSKLGAEGEMPSPPRTRLNVYRIRFEIPDMVNTSGIVFRDGRTHGAAIEKAIAEIPSETAFMAGRVDWKLVAKRCTLEQYRAAHPEAEDEL